MMLYGDKKAVGEKEVVIKIEWAGGSTKGNGSWRNIAGGSENNNRGVCCALARERNKQYFVCISIRGPRPRTEEGCCCSVRGCAGQRGSSNSHQRLVL